MKKSIKKSHFDFLTFIALIAINYSLSWTTHDLVWSFWLSSIVVGYIIIISNISQIPRALFKVSEHKEFKEQAKMSKNVIYLIAFGISLFLIGFFTVHFLAFHLGHSMFLNSFFPLEGQVVKARGFINFEYLFSLLSILVPQYWPMIVVSLFSKRDHILHNESEFKMKNMSKSIGTEPYKNVMKIHCLIFILVGLKTAKIDQNIIHLIVLTIFSIDFGSFINLDKKKKNKKRRGPKTSRKKKLSSSS